MPPRRLQISRLLYWLAVISIFALAAIRRFSLPLIPILDLDSPNFLWPALLKLNGAGFVHNAGLNFIYPGFLFLLLRGFADFRAIVVAQHLFGLAGGLFFLLGWNRLQGLAFASRLSRLSHRVIGLFGVALYLLSPTPILFEQQIRSEALCLPVQLLSLWLLFQFLFYRADRRKLTLYGLGGIASALLLGSLKPSFILSALVTIALILLFVLRSRSSRKIRALFFASALLLVLVFVVPERWLARKDRLSRMFLPETLFCVHANIIHDQMTEDLARGVTVPFPPSWLRTACDELGAEIERLRVAPPGQFSLLGFDPDHLMNGENAIVTRWLQQLGSDAELKRFLDYYFWRAVRQRPLAFGEKIARQTAVFYASRCPAFTAYPRIALVAWHYQQSLAVMRDPENWEQIGAAPGGVALLAATEKYAERETFFDSGMRTYFFHRVLGWAYLPVLLVSVVCALWRLLARRTGADWPSALVFLLFFLNFGNVFAISVVHSMEVLRYSTVQYGAALFAEFWAIRYLLGLLLQWLPRRGSTG